MKPKYGVIFKLDGEEALALPPNQSGVWRGQEWGLCEGSEFAIQVNEGHHRQVRGKEKEFKCVAEFPKMQVAKFFCSPQPAADAPDGPGRLTLVSISEPRFTLDLHTQIIPKGGQYSPIPFRAVRDQLAMVPTFPVTLSKIVGHLGTINTLLRKSAPLVPLIGQNLRAACDLFDSLLEHFKNNEPIVGNLAGVASDLSDLLEGVVAPIREVQMQLHAEFEKVVHQLWTLAYDCGEFLDKYRSHPTFQHLLVSAVSDANRVAIERLKTRLASIRPQLTRGINMQTLLNTKELLDGQAIDALKVVPKATHNLGGRSKCLAKTRQRMLAEAISKITKSNREPGKSFFWLTGAPGSGKSALAASIAYTLEHEFKDSISTAYYFCQRTDNGTTDPRDLLQALARRLGGTVPEFRSHLAASLRRHRDEWHIEPKKQIEFLLIEPFGCMDPGGYRVVVLIDGLDEFEGGGSSRGLLLDSLKTASKELPQNVTFVIVSRATEQISSSLSDVSHRFLNLDKHLDSVGTKEDVKAYLEHHLKEIGKVFGPNWPDESAIDRLAGYSRGLFIIAEVAWKFVKGPGTPTPNSIRGSRPHEQRLDSLLAKLQEGLDPGLAKEELVNELYTFALKDAFDSNGTLLENLYQPLMGALLFVAQPLSANALASLVGDVDPAKQALKLLRPLLYGDLESGLRIEQTSSSPVPTRRQTAPAMMESQPHVNATVSTPIEGDEYVHLSDTNTGTLVSDSDSEHEDPGSAIQGGKCVMVKRPQEERTNTGFSESSSSMDRDNPLSGNPVLPPPTFTAPPEASSHDEGGAQTEMRSSTLKRPASPSSDFDIDSSDAEPDLISLTVTETDSSPSSPSDIEDQNIGNNDPHLHSPSSPHAHSSTHQTKKRKTEQDPELAATFRAFQEEFLTVLHALLPEFLTAPDNKTPYHVGGGLSHLQLALRCQEIMAEHLRFNICEIEDSSQAIADLHDVEERRSRLPEHLRYACCYWAYHLEHAEVVNEGDKEALIEQAQSFLTERKDCVEVVAKLVSLVRGFLMDHFLPCKLSFSFRKPDNHARGFGPWVASLV